MIQTVLTPNNTNLNITIPVDYVGKKVHLIFYTDDEINTTMPTITSQKKPSDFVGIISKQTAKSILEDISKSREQWDRII
jgi:hypothetical protein